MPRSFQDCPSRLNNLAVQPLDRFCAVQPGAMLAGRACAGLEPLATFWIEPEPSIWPAGAFRFGLRPESLVIVAASGVDSLWAAEEALRCPDVGATCLVHSKPIDMPSSRRLQLAAETGGGIGLILVRPPALAQPSAARTRWRVVAAPGIGAREYALGEPTWHVELAKAAGGRPGTWDLVWCEEDQALIPVFAVEEHLKRRDQAAAGPW